MVAERINVDLVHENLEGLTFYRDFLDQDAAGLSEAELIEAEEYSEKDEDGEYNPVLLDFRKVMVEFFVWWHWYAQGKQPDQ